MTRSTTPVNPLVISAQDAATVLGVGLTTVRKLMREKQLTTVHIGRAVRIPMSALTDYLERQTDR